MEEENIKNKPPSIAVLWITALMPYLPLIALIIYNNAFPQVHTGCGLDGLANLGRGIVLFEIILLLAVITLVSGCCIAVDALAHLSKGIAPNLWAVSSIIIPFIAAPLYLIINRNRRQCFPKPTAVSNEDDDLSYLNVLVFLPLLLGIFSAIIIVSTYDILVLFFAPPVIVMGQFALSIKVANDADRRLQGKKSRLIWIFLLMLAGILACPIYRIKYLRKKQLPVKEAD